MSQARLPMSSLVCAEALLRCTAVLAQELYVKAASEASG